jgi:hypothetical protein
MRSPYYAVFSRYSEREIQAATEEIRERFGERYRNPAINAQMLAKFLSEVDQQERLMGMEREPVRGGERTRAESSCRSDNWANQR